MKLKSTLVLTAVVLLALCGCGGGRSLSLPGGFSVPGRPGTQLAGVLTLPRGEGPFPALVLLHGGSGLVQSAYRPWVERLGSWGYVVLQVDSFSRRGLSMQNNYGNLPYSELIRGRARDAVAAGGYLAALPCVDPGRIGLIGWSQGATAVIETVGQKNHLPAVFAAAIAFYPQCRTMIDDIYAPLLVLAGDRDTICPAYLCRLMLPLDGASREIEFVVYRGARHAFDFKGAGSEAARGEHPGRPYRHHPEAAAAAGLKVRAFLDRHLK